MCYGIIMMYMYTDILFFVHNLNVSCLPQDTFKLFCYSQQSTVVFLLHAACSSDPCTAEHDILYFGNRNSMMIDKCEFKIFLSVEKVIF